MNSNARGVQLPDGVSGSGFLFSVLTRAVAEFPQDLAAARLPTSSKRFKKAAGDLLARFEMARIASPQRVEIARFLLKLTHEPMRFGNDAISSAFSNRVEAPKTVERAPSPASPWVPEVPFEGRAWKGSELRELVKRLYADHHMTTAARDALLWIVDFTEKSSGALDLRGQKFALIGAGAELAPTELLLNAGATVRWLDVKPPPPGLPAAGHCISSATPDDVLEAPQATAAAIREFAKDGPVHVGLFAYAPGSSRELRLGVAMDALVRDLGPQVVKSVSLFVSPTSPGEMQPEDLEVSETRRKRHAFWQAGFQRVRMLKPPGFERSGNAVVCKASISLQGASYLAAQYLTKIISAEVLAADGLDGKPITLSANVAGITATRSLSHPLFLVAFQGAPAFGVRIFEPATTRALSGLLMLHDLLNPAAPGSATASREEANVLARRVRAEQIHGGVYDLPWQFESAVRVAAVLGLGKRPDLLLRKK